MRNPASIQCPQLREMVQEAILKDYHFSPLAEESKQQAGEAREREISHWLSGLSGVPWAEEKALRKRGLAKTPDFVLEVPIAISFGPSSGPFTGWRTINWIESKASFGSESMHKRVLAEQLHAYHNRYGPGLVIYWGGHVKEINDQDRSIIASDRLPESVQTIASVYL